MSSPITHAEIARAALRFVRASRAHAKHAQGIRWEELDRHDLDREMQTANDLADEYESARTELYGLCGRYEAQEARP